MHTIYVYMHISVYTCAHVCAYTYLFSKVRDLSLLEELCSGISWLHPLEFTLGTILGLQLFPLHVSLWGPRPGERLLGLSS